MKLETPSLLWQQLQRHGNARSGAWAASRCASNPSQAATHDTARQLPNPCSLRMKNASNGLVDRDVNTDCQTDRLSRQRQRSTGQSSRRLGWTELNGRPAHAS